MMPAASRELNAVAAIVAREVVRTARSPLALIVSLVFPLIFLGIMGGSVAQNLAGDIGYSYMQFVMIGMLVNSVFMTTISGMSNLIEERDHHMTQVLFVAPISRFGIILGKMIGAALTSLVGVAGLLLVSAAMRIPLGGGQLVQVLLLTPVFALVGASMGALFIGLVRDSKAADAGTMLILMPQMFLSGVIIPVAQSSGILGVLAKLMPLTYCVDLARAVFYAGRPEYEGIVMHHPMLNMTVMAGCFVVFFAVGTALFVRSERNR